MMARLETWALVLGMVMLALGAGLFDVRLGLLAAGVMLILSAVDFRGVRR